jgi:hypothetical protein
MCETSRNEKPVKPPKSETQYKMHTNSGVDVLRLIEKLAIISKASHAETSRSNKNKEMQNM